MNRKSFLLLLIPLVLSAYTHLWNPIGFPVFHPDEGVYLRRSLHVLAGLGPQDPNSRFDHSQETNSSYDHPYFGQLLLAGVFSLIGYPDHNASADSIEYHFAVPRVIIGMFSILDTFLIYKICEHRYNRSVALIAAILFAVMPLSWLTRRIVLDSILLPFLLLSILLLVQTSQRSRNTAILYLLSGICMGLSIFTKIPAFTIIPLGLYLINGTIPKSSKNHAKLKFISVWLLPAILVPLLWPAYALYLGQFDEWLQGVSWQGTERQTEGRTLADTLINFWGADIVLFMLGLAGIVFCSVRRDFLPLIWVVPYFVLLYFVGWVTHFHLILILPPFCIAIANMMEKMPRLLVLRRSKIVTSISLVVITVFGVVVTTMLITTNVSWTQIQGAHLVENYSSQYNYQNGGEKGKITIIASPIFSWLFKYVFNNEDTFTHIRDTRDIETENLVMVVDAVYHQIISGNEGENKSQIDRLQKIYNDTEIIALFKSDWSTTRDDYPYNGMEAAGTRTRTVEIRGK